MTMVFAPLGFIVGQVPIGSQVRYWDWGIVLGLLLIVACATAPELRSPRAHPNQPELRERRDAAHGCAFPAFIGVGAMVFAASLAAPHEAHAGGFVVYGAMGAFFAYMVYALVMAVTITLFQLVRRNRSS